MKVLVLAAAAMVAASGVANAQDAAAGEQVFKQCRACHTVGPDARNLVGPLLNGLEGRKAGTIEGYSYSDANKNSGIVWDEATFKDYIADPLKKIPGTKMQFVGIKNEKDAANLWAYLRQFKADGSKK
ncbi:MAG TPA: cytochrome c family protein [Xanthobacteraceae bacterium]|nr:cytochrome c family protein [Xanthobacteraceae bacterium]